MAFQPKTFLDLCFSMKTKATVDIDGQVGVISCVEREGGSGYSWNVSIMHDDGFHATVFFRENQLAT